MNTRLMAALAAAPLWACGGDGAARDVEAVAGEATTTTTTMASCEILTAAHASEAMGEPMQGAVEQLRHGDPSSGRAMLQCQHDATTSSASLTVQLLWSPDYDRPANFAEFAAALRAESTNADDLMHQANLEMLAAAVPVEGLGRFGYWIPDTRTLTVHTGRGHAVTIGVARWGTGSSADADLAIARSAAAVVLDRL